VKVFQGKKWSWAKTSRMGEKKLQLGPGEGGREEH